MDKKKANKVSETETLKVEIEIPANYVRFLKYVFDDNPEDDLNHYMTRCVESDIESMLDEGHHLGKYLLPKIRKMFPGLPGD